MVLVDRSVWIRFFANRAPYAEHLDSLLGRDEVVGHPFVFGELLIGHLGGRDRFLGDYAKMNQVGIVAHSDVVSFVQARRLHGRGVGWVDAHLLHRQHWGDCGCGQLTRGWPLWPRISGSSIE